MVEKDWAPEAVIELCNKRLADGLDVVEAFKPMHQWEALRAFDTLQVVYEAGDDFALFETISLCAMTDLPLPLWASYAFLRGYRALVQYKVGTWEEAFGPAPAKGKHLHDARQRWELRPRVWESVRRRKTEGQAIDDLLFEDVGSEFGIGKTLTKRLYYDFQKQMGRSISNPAAVALLSPFARPRPPRTSVSRKFPRVR
jgi:hypothetical protein